MNPTARYRWGNRQDCTSENEKLQNYSVCPPRTVRRFWSFLLFAVSYINKLRVFSPFGGSIPTAPTCFSGVFPLRLVHDVHAAATELFKNAMI